MIRPAAPADLAPIVSLAVAAGLAPPGQTAELEAVLGDHFAGRLGPDHLWVVDDDGGVVGAAYVAQERMTDGTWNLYLIAVAPARQGAGRGAALVAHAERAAADRGGRIMVVDTSSLPEFDRTRAFYRKQGYAEEARVRDFWKAGDDKVIFRKALRGGA